MNEAEVQQISRLLLTDPLNIQACDEFLVVRMLYQTIDQKIYFLEGVQKKLRVDFYSSNTEFTNSSGMVEALETQPIKTLSKNNEFAQDNVLKTRQVRQGQFILCDQNLNRLLTHYWNRKALNTGHISNFNIDYITHTSSVSTLTVRGNASQLSDSVGSISSADRLRIERERNTNAQTFFYHPDNREPGIQNSQIQLPKVIDERRGFR